MATIVYLDAEDEITTAASRIRRAGGARVGVVIPFGSRVATSRINFRLLAREALDAGRRLDIVAPDPSARALAASAGLPVFASVGAYESALAHGDLDDAPAAGPATPAGSFRELSPAGRPAGAPADTARQEPPRGAEPERRIATPSRSAGASAASALDAGKGGGRRRGPRRALVGLVLLLALVLGFGGAAAALLLPSAEITLTPRMDWLTPVTLAVRADPSAANADQAARVIPAAAVSVPVTARANVTATGSNIVQTVAKGAVTFDSINTVNAMPIASGTRVSTLDGIVFTTTAAVTVPRATVSGTTIAHGYATVGVVAGAAGPKGNVAARAINQVPSSLASLQVSVSNASATAGGARTVTPKVTAADVKTATDALARDLASQVAAATANPSIAPAGTTLYPQTAVLGPVSYTPNAASLVGKVLSASQSTLTLQAAATATVTAVDESSLKVMGEQAIRAAVAPGRQIVEDSIAVTVGRGVVGADRTVSYTVTADALEERSLDAAALKASILGKTETEAKAALAAYGDVAVRLSPFWVSAVPTLAESVTLTISTPARPSAPPPPQPSAAPAATGSPAPPVSPVPSS